VGVELKQKVEKCTRAHVHMRTRTELQLLAEAGGIASNRFYTLQQGLMGCACLYTGCVLVSC
jgi:hypothetical protein